MSFKRVKKDQYNHSCLCKHWQYKLARIRMISFCLSVIIGTGYFGHCSHPEMSVQLCISTVILQQQSNQKMYEGLDKLHPFLFHYCYINTIEICVPSTLPPPFSFGILWNAGCCFGLRVPRDSVKLSGGSVLAGNLMWKAGIVVGATEQDLEVVDGLIVLKRSQFFFFPVSFLNLSAPFSHSNLSSLFLFTLSNQALSAFQLLSATQPSALWHLCNHHSLFSGKYPKIPCRWRWPRRACRWRIQVLLPKKACFLFIVLILFAYWWKMSLDPVWKAYFEKHKSYPWPFQVWHLSFSSHTSLLKASVPLHLPVIPVISAWGLSKVINECFLKTGPVSFDHGSMQVSHILRTSIRWWPEELLLPLS